MGIFSSIAANIKSVFKQSERDVRTVLKQQATLVKAATLDSIQQSLAQQGGPQAWGVIDEIGVVGRDLTLAEAYVLCKQQGGRALFRVVNAP